MGIEGVPEALARLIHLSAGTSFTTDVNPKVSHSKHPVTSILELNAGHHEIGTTHYRLHGTIELGLEAFEDLPLDDSHMTAGTEVRPTLEPPALHR